MSRSHEAGPDEPTGEIDLRAIGTALKRRRRTWIVPTLAVLAATTLYVSVTTPRYTAQSQILLENQETFFTRPDRVNLPNEVANQLDEAAVASQVALIASPDIARRAIKALKLAGDDEFDPLAGGMNPLTRLLVVFGILPDPSRETAEARMVQNFGKKLTVFSPPKTRIVTIEFTSRDPDLAARGANEVAKLYLEEQSAAKRSMARGSAEALSAQIAELRGKLTEADAARERYRLSSGLLAGTNNMTISGQSLADINTDLSRARAQMADAQAKAATIRELVKDGRAADVADVTNSPIVRQLWNQRSQAQAQLATESRTLLPEHPRVKELAAQLKEYDAALKSAAKQAATTLENDAKVAGQRVANLEAALSQQKKLVGVANSDEVHLNALDRVSQGLKDQLQSSTTKYEEAMARQTSAATPADARVISQATPPQEPSWPKKLPIVIFGTLAALIFSTGWVVASEIVSGRADVGAEPDADQIAPARAAEREAPAARNKPLAASSNAATREPSRRDRPSRRVSDRVEPALGRSSGTPDFWPEEEAGDADIVGPEPPRFRRAALPAGLAAGIVALRHLVEAVRPDRETALEDFVLAPVRPRISQQPLEGRRFGRVRALASYLADFGKPASAMPGERADGRRRKEHAPVRAADIGWAQDGESEQVETRLAEAGQSDHGEAPLAAAEAQARDVAARIVAGHVPGRGLHVIGTGIGAEASSCATIIALARSLSEKGRSILVDLNATPARLASLAPGGNRATMMTLDGLSELLAGEIGFAEVIHRDHATRLHFIPSGRREADFRDFDLILDALTETYDFIVLLTPAFPQSEIAKVMAPYADVMVLSAAPDATPDLVRVLEGELTSAGAREVLVAGVPGEAARVVA